MRNPKIAQELLNLQNLIDQSSSAELDLSLRGHWAQYLCVRAAGFLENSLEAIYADFARARGSDPRVARFVAKQLERIYNPKTPTFLRTAGQFDETWERELAAFLNADPDRRKGGINSIIEYKKPYRSWGIGCYLTNVGKRLPYAQRRSLRVHRRPMPAMTRHDLPTVLGELAVNICDLYCCG